MSAKCRPTILEPIHWIDVSEELPEPDSEVLVCFERNDSLGRNVTIAIYDDSIADEIPWKVDSRLIGFGIVLYWADIPAGPQRS